MVENALAEEPQIEKEPESLEPTPLSGPATEVREARLIPVDSRLLMDIDGVGEHLESRLVGILPGQTLIVETPATAQPIRDQFYLNRKVVVRFVAAGEVRGFRSRVAHSMSRPCDLLFLSYPESFEQVTLRRQARFTALLPARITIGEQTFDGALTDISEGGCGFSTRLRQETPVPEIGETETIRIDFQLPVDGKPISLPGNAKYQDPISKGSLQIGVSFQDVPAEVVEQLRGYVASLASVL